MNIDAVASYRIEQRQHVIALNAELSPLWPVINKRKDPLPDATEWDGKPNKLPLLER